MLGFCFSTNGVIPHLKASLLGKAGWQHVMEPHSLRASVACGLRPLPLYPGGALQDHLPGLPYLHISCPAPEALNRLLLLSLPSWLSLLPLPAWKAPPPHPRGCIQVALGSRIRQVGKPSDSCFALAQQPSWVQPPRPKRPRSPGGHAASLLCNHMASRGRGKKGYAFPPSCGF